MNRKDAEARPVEKAQDDPVPPADGPLDDIQLDAVAGGRADQATSTVKTKHDKTATEILGNMG